MRGTWNSLRAQWQKQPASVAFALLVLLGLAAAAGYFYGYRNYVGRRHLRAANDALARYEFQEACGELEQVLAVWPTDATAHFLLGQTHRRLEDFARADEHLELARRFGYPQAAIDLENVLKVAQVEGLPPRAILALGDYMKERGPEEILILEALATGFHRQRRFLETGHWLQYWVKHYPNDWRARYWRGSYYLQVGTHSEAERDFERCLEFNPRHAEAHRGLGIAILKTGTDFAKARKHFELFLKDHPDDVDAQVTLARCLRQLNEPAAAKAVLEKVLAQRPLVATALLQMGQLASDEGELQQALDHLAKADGQSFRDTEDVALLISNLANVSQRLGREAEAKVYQERLTRFNQDSRALNEAMEKMSQGKADPDMAYEVGSIYLRIGLHDDGERWLLSVLEGQPYDRRANQALFDFYAQRKDPESQRRAEVHRQALLQSTTP